MRYCHERKLAFFFPSRTGGVTLANYFNYWMVDELKPTGSEHPNNPDKERELSWNLRHIFPKDGEKVITEVKNYTRYSFFRNPYHRFMSICNRMQLFEPHLSVPKVMRNFDKYKDNIMFAPQINYYDNVNLLDFDNYESEVRKIGAMFGDTTFVLYKYNSRPFLKSHLTEQVKDFIRINYSEDFKLGKDVFGKEY